MSSHRKFLDTSRVTQGFTLIEMMVVMLLLGLLAGVVLPNFERWFESIKSKTTANELSNQLQKLLTRAALLETDFELNHSTSNQLLADGQVALQLPEGWHLQQEHSLKIWRSGICNSNIIEFKSEREVVVLEIEEQTCFVTVNRSFKITP